jgi:uncharacterized integral membrane protein
MRTIKLIILALILIAIVVLSLANRDSVVLKLLPEGMARIMPLSIELPLFVVSLISILVGMVIGYLLEWLREHKHRKQASVKTREADQLARENERLRRKGKPEDDVLALIGN